MYIPSTQSLSPLDMMRSLLVGTPSANDQRIYFSYARYAFEALARALACIGIKEIIAPAYICREALERLNKDLVPIRFYDIRPDLTPDFQQVYAMPSGERAFLLVHYFGFPNALKESLRLCREKGYMLIEDCAQALYSEEDGRPLGSFGDAAVFSPRKFLPLPHGAYLVVPGGKIQEFLRPPVGDSPKTIQYLLHNLGRWLLFQSGFSVRGRNAVMNLRPEDRPLMTPGTKPVMTTTLSRMLTWFEAGNDIVRRRRRNYERLSGKLGPLPVRPLFPELSSGICPLAFPLVTSRLDEIITGLRKWGIGAQFWPTLADGVLGNDRFPSANRMRRELLLLPIHQDLSTGHVDYILSCLTRMLTHGN